jgi:hypothetical protein
MAFAVDQTQLVSGDLPARLLRMNRNRIMDQRLHLMPLQMGLQSITLFTRNNKQVVNMR